MKSNWPSKPTFSVFYFFYSCLTTNQKNKTCVLRLTFSFAKVKTKALGKELATELAKAKAKLKAIVKRRITTSCLPQLLPINGQRSRQKLTREETGRPLLYRLVNRTEAKVFKIKFKSLRSPSQGWRLKIRTQHMLLLRSSSSRYPLTSAQAHSSKEKYSKTNNTHPQKVGFNSSLGSFRVR